MKKIIISSILFISLVFVAPIQVSAATNAGVKPGSFFYFFDTAFENVGIFFTFNSEQKAKKALGYADERLAEAEESASENNPKAVEKAMTGYKEEVSFATEKSKELKDAKKAEELLNIVSENTAKHQEVLKGVLEKVPDEAKEAILKAIEVSKKSQEEAVKQIAELKNEVERLKKEVEELKKANESSNENSKTNNQSAELEKLKREVDELKNRKVNPPSAGIIKEQPKSTATQETPKQRQNYDQELSQMIAEARQRISVFSGAVKEAIDFIPIVRNTMDKYLGDSTIQSSGQELINENNNFASISKKLVDTETQRVNKLSSYLGLGIVPSVDDFPSIVRDYDNYYKQYEASNARIESLMRAFVANEKSTLERKLAQERQELDELKKLLSQEMTARQKKLTDLEAQIEIYQKQYDTACEGVSMSFCSGSRAGIASKLNPLIDQYNALLGNNTGKVYSPVRQTYLRFEADSFGRGGRLYDPNGSTNYTFDCDQWNNCSIYGN